MIQVIGAGFGRTGTLSLKAALEELGFGPCYHMVEVFGKERHIELWQAATDGKPVDWNELFDGYQAAVDWPVCAFYDRLMEAYPKAKVVLTVRDPQRWYDSALQTIYWISKNRPAEMVAAMPFSAEHGRMIETLIWQGTFGGAFEDKDRAIAIYERHNREVKERVPADRLLVFEVKEGWEPLCRFLNVDVPADKPFPRLNEAEGFRQMVQEATQSAGSAPGHQE